MIDPTYLGTIDAGIWHAETSTSAALAYYSNVSWGRDSLPDEALINAMGRTWVMWSAMGVYFCTDEEWTVHVTPWLAAYNRAYLSELQRLLELDGALEGAW